MLESHPEPSVLTVPASSPELPFPRTLRAPDPASRSAGAPRPSRRLWIAWIAAAAVIVTSLYAAPARAAAAEDFVKAKHAELSDLLRQDKSKAREKKLEAVFEAMLDYDTLARESLGEYWEERSDTQRRAFRELLQGLVQRAYRKNLDKTLSYDVTFHGEEAARRGKLVKTIARSKKNKREEPLSIDYLVHDAGGSLKVFDIVTAGSSLLNNYKNQFRRIIRKHGFEELMRRMQKKLESD
jgi:phospholipid transport system substrate-binding protein